MSIGKVIQPAHVSAPQLYAGLRRELMRRGATRTPSTVHHPENLNPQWESEKQCSLAVRFARQVFHLQLALERHVINAGWRVILFGRRLDPPSTALSKNTQRATFNSANYGECGYYLRPQLPKTGLALRRGLAATLSHSRAPSWQDGKINLGRGPLRAVLDNFLKGVAVLEDLKGMGPADLERQFPPAPAFTVADIRSVEQFSEGGVGTANRRIRKRSRKLLELATEHYVRLSPDGRLRCAVDNWAPAVPVRGAIVEIHHDEALQDYPDTGRSMTLDEALQFLFPLCPNCHGTLHSKPGGGRYTVDELKRLSRKKHPAGYAL